VRARVEAAAKAAAGAPADAARAALERGGVFGAAPAAAAAPSPRLDALTPFTLPAEPVALALVAFPTALRGDGRTDVPWLKEVADATSTVAWTPWAEVSPATAGKLGLQTGRKVSLTTAAGTAEFPVYVYPSMRDGVVAVPLGARETMAVLPSGATAAPSVTVKAIGPALLPQLEGFPEPHAGALFTQIGGEKPEGLSPIRKLPMYEPPPYKKHRWAMVIDLDKCTGCNACTVACYAENNIPVLGPERIDEGRSMAWIRLDRFFGEDPQPSVDFVPMLCQHCDNAPCEVVCPADATYHTGEGLNAQVYNRCIGTRYCANNCPYKVRVFNWQDPQFPSPLNLGLNPDVNVRSKGVMEKCSFCVQRIRFGENAARDEDRDVRDGDITSACAQTCPAQAITFGDAMDPKSRVSLAAKDPRGFQALGDLNTRPAITYLAKQKDSAPKEKKG